MIAVAARSKASITMHRSTDEIVGSYPARCMET